jgi:hypothetical protein
MRIVIKLTAEQAEAVERFRAEQVRPETNPATGQQMMVPIYETVEDMIVQTIGATILSTALNRFPPAAAMQDLLDIKRVQDRMAKRAMPELAKPGE